MKEGWKGCYWALTPQGRLVPLGEWFARQDPALYADPVHRLERLAGPRSGDLLLISNYSEGFYFSSPQSGVHGGLHPDDSRATLAIGWPGVPQETWDQASHSFTQAIQFRCRAEGSRQPTTTDLLVGLKALIE